MSIEAQQITLVGMDLENAVRREVGLSSDWVLSDMQTLLLRVRELGLAVWLYAAGSDAQWTCDMGVGSCTPGTRYASEISTGLPGSAVARAALAAVRHLVTTGLAGVEPMAGGVCPAHQHPFQQRRDGLWGCQACDIEATYGVPDVTPGTEAPPPTHHKQTIFATKVREGDIITDPLTKHRLVVRKVERHSSWVNVIVPGEDGCDRRMSYPHEVLLEVERPHWQVLRVQAREVQVGDRVKDPQTGEHYTVWSSRQMRPDSQELLEFRVGATNDTHRVVMFAWTEVLEVERPMPAEPS